MDNLQTRKNRESQWKTATTSLSLSLTRRDLMRRAGQALVGLTALTLLLNPTTANAQFSGKGSGKPVRALATPTPAPTQQLPLWGDAAGWNQPQYYQTMQMADVDRDGRNELLIRGPQGMLIQRFNHDAAHGQWTPLSEDGLGWSDANGWNQPQYYRTIQCADLDGDGAREILARGPHGIVGYKYNKTTGKFTPLNSTGSESFSDQGGWDQPEYYSTIHCGDVDGDGREELIGRGYADVIVWKYSDTGWTAITRGPRWADDPAATRDGTQWNLPQYYETIRLADVDGDRAKEILGRSKTGIEVWKYHPNNSSWTFTQGPWTWTDAGGYNRPAYYQTLRCGDIDGDGQDEVMLRDADSLDIWKYNKDSGAWYSYAYSPQLSDSAGWYLAQYGTTLRLADIDGDKQDELIARYKDGIHCWKFTKGNFVEITPGPQWSDTGTGGTDNSNPVPDSNDTSWNQVEYYSTLCSGDIDKNGSAELIARDKYCVQTWKYDTSSKTWQRTTATFPDFTSTAVSPNVRDAYAYLNRALRGDGALDDFRSTYYNLTAPLSTYLGLLTSGVDHTGRPFSPPSTVTDSDWAEVKGQIQSEVENAINVKSWYGVANTIITQTYLSQGFSLTTIGNQQLNIPGNSTAKTVLSCLTILANISKALLSIGGPTTAPATAISGLLGTVFTLTSSFLNNNGAPYQEQYNLLEGKLNEAFQQALVVNGNLQEQVMKDYGLLSAIGTMVDTGQWSVEDTLSAQMVSAAQRSYETSIYQMLTPLVWKVAATVHNVRADYQLYTYQMPNPYANNTLTYYLGVTKGLSTLPTSIPLPILQHLFDHPTTPHPIASDPLGLSIRDAIIGANGWSIPIIAGVRPTATWNPQPDLSLSVQAERNALASQIQVTLTVENSGFGPATPVTNVEIVSAKLGSVNTLTSLPLGRTRLDANATHTVTLAFPATAGRPGQTVVLQVRGTYKGGTFGGSLRVKLP